MERRMGIGGVVVGLVKLSASAFMVLCAAGCAPNVTGATAILPAQTGDSPSTWIYLHTDDKTTDGIYRCTDAGDGKPVCRRAKIAAPCTRDRCGE
jgi:hypothetical protein